jgi:hypothetical protein
MKTFPFFAVAMTMLGIGLSQAFGVAATPSAAETVSSEGAGPHSFLAGSPGSERFNVTLEIKKDDQAMQTVDTLKLQWSDGRTQTLPVKSMSPVPEGDNFFLATIDLNFDGHRDLCFATARGAGANTYCDYWIYNAKNQAFVHLGNYPLLQVDPAAHTISSHESEGAAGLLYIEKQYCYRDGNLELTGIVEQTATANPKTYLKSCYKIQNGKRVLIKTDKVDVSEVN